jgi:hypothetical protein
MARRRPRGGADGSTDGRARRPAGGAAAATPGTAGAAQSGPSPIRGGLAGHHEWQTTMACRDVWPKADARRGWSDRAARADRRRTAVPKTTWPTSRVTILATDHSPLQLYTDHP